MEEKPGLVLIHGAGLGSWIWEDFGRLLDSPWLPLDYPERQKNAVPQTFSLEDYSRHMLRRIQGWDQPKLVLVAHSIGGVLALKIAAKLVGRVVGIIGVGAAIPIKGQSFQSCIPFPKRLISTLMMRMAGTKPPASAIRKGLCSDLEVMLADKVVKRYVAESPRLYSDRCEADVPVLETLYVRLGRDKAFPVGLQDRMAGNLLAQTIVTLPSGHLPMLSKPGLLASIINEFAAGAGRETGQAMTQDTIASA